MSLILFLLILTVLDSFEFSIGASTLATRAETFALEATLVRNYVIADE
jgi:hypothetical protein